MQSPRAAGNRRGAKVRATRLLSQRFENDSRLSSRRWATRRVDSATSPFIPAAQHKPSPGRMSASAALSAGAPDALRRLGRMDARTWRRPPTSHRCAGKRDWEGNFQDLSGVFEAGHHRDVPSSPPKAAKLTFPMSLGPDGGLPRGPVESRTKHHYVCSGCLIDRLGSGLRHGRLHRLTMEKVTALASV
jgi:hypothetical protein